ncbi:MAG: hypothetical protein KF808_07595 [Cryobacterium sp.]|nr:hypothetical protein [Cryobacterium sp.]
MLTQRTRGRVALGVSALATSFVVLVASPAMAAPTEVYVTPSVIAGGDPWMVGFQTGTAAWEIIPDSDHYYGDDALHITTPLTGDAVGFWHEFATGISPADFTMSYSTKQLTPTGYALPSIFIYVELNNDVDFSSGDYVYLAYEPIYNNPGSLDTKVWQDWSLSSTSNVWITGDYNASTLYPPATYTVPYSTFSTDPRMSNALIMGVYLNQGTGNPGWDALLDKVNLGGDETYNFELTAPAAEDPGLAESGSESALPLAGAAVLVILGSGIVVVNRRNRKRLA